MPVQKNFEELLTASYTRIVVRDPEGTYSSRVLEWPGCFSGGTTEDEALRNLDVAMRLWLEVALEDGNSIPEPIRESDYSGRILLRLPSSLHERASHRADAEQTSLNQLLVAAVAQYLGEVDAVDRVLSALAAQSASPAAIRSLIAEPPAEYTS